MRSQPLFSTKSLVSEIKKRSLLSWLMNFVVFVIRVEFYNLKDSEHLTHS